MVAVKMGSYSSNRNDKILALEKRPKNSNGRASVAAIEENRDGGIGDSG
jgi:hypothetical protein